MQEQFHTTQKDDEILPRMRLEKFLILMKNVPSKQSF